MLDQAIDALPPPRAEVVQAIQGGRSLPLLDAGPFLAGVPGAAEQLAADVRAIQQTLGFLAIVNHGIEQSLIDAATAQTYQLFALPEEIKLKSLKQEHMQGYWPANSVANVRPGYEKDHEKERNATVAGWTFLRDRDENDAKVKAGLRHRAMNKWPDPTALPDFRPTMRRYHKAMVDLGLKLIPIYAAALGLPSDYFAKDFVNPEWYARCNFLAGQADAADDAMGITAHSDHSFLTMLPIASVPGLQVRTPSGAWMDVPNIRSAIVVNTGEWLNRISCGRFLATPHRVQQPKQDRVSIPVFIDPNDEARCDPMPGGLKPGETSQFPPVAWHAFFASYIDGYTKPK